MIVVDTSVWIDYFHGKDSRFTYALDEALGKDTVVTGDLIMLGILLGFKVEKDYNLARNTLKTLEQFELLGNDMVIKCTNSYRKLRKSGITVRQTTGVIIGSFCVENKLSLLFQDKDFIPFVRKLGLKSALVET